MGCFSPWELPKGQMPDDCPFGGKVRELNLNEEEEFITTPSWELRIIYKSNLFQWR